MKYNSNSPKAIKTKQSGFTLMEMIGVMAVIAILASAAAPPIFEAIEDAKVSAYIQEIHTLKLAVTRYYKDTGRWPKHRATDIGTESHNLITNKADSSGTPIPGWNGPYLEQELVNQITRGEYQITYPTSDPLYTCDLDGDGVKDGTFSIFHTSGVSDKIAKKISNIIDGDGAITTGNGRWQAAGKIRRYGATSESTTSLIYCITRV